MKRSYLIALSGISAALSVIFVIAAVYLPTMQLALYVLSAFSTVLPIAKKMPSGSIMSYIVTSAVVLAVANVRSLPYVFFFGLYSIVTWALDFKLYKIEKLPKWALIAIITVIKILFFFGSFFGCFYLMKMVIADITLFNFTWTMPLLTLGAFIVFSVYDMFYRWCFKNEVTMINKYIKK